MSIFDKITGRRERRATPEMTRTIGRVFAGNPSIVVKDILKSYLPQTTYEAVDRLDLTGLFDSIKRNPENQTRYFENFLQSSAVVALFAGDDNDLERKQVLNQLNTRFTIEQIVYPNANVAAFLEAFTGDNPDEMWNVMGQQYYSEEDRTFILTAIQGICNEFTAGKLAVEITGRIGGRMGIDVYFTVDQFLARIEHVHEIFDQLATAERNRERLEEQVPEAKELDELAGKLSGFFSGDLIDMVEGYKESIGRGVLNGQVPVKEAQGLMSELLGTLKRFDDEKDPEKKKMALGGFIERLKGGVANLAALGGLALTGALMWTALASFYLPVWLTMKAEESVKKILK